MHVEGHGEVSHLTNRDFGAGQKMVAKLETNKAIGNTLQSNLGAVSLHRFLITTFIIRKMLKFK